MISKNYSNKKTKEISQTFKSAQFRLISFRTLKPGQFLDIFPLRN